MNRRGHLSHKIPNVKLRPAPAATAARPAGEREASPENMMNKEIKRQAWANADHDESPAAFNKVSRPLEGVTITFTGVENKIELANMAKEMGATVDANLTISVTHLIASHAGSQKYNYAIMHRLPVLAPSWLLACHHEWLEGAEVNAVELAKDHGLLPLIGLKIAVSGIEPAERRKQVQELVYEYGGLYSKVLDRTCSHLISSCSANDPNASAKVKWALEQNENRRSRGEKEGEIAMVYEEWFWDCVHFNGRWPEVEYDIRGDRPPSRAAEDEAKQARIAAAALPLDLPDEKDPVALRKRRKEGLGDLIGELISTTTTTAHAAETSQAAKERSLSPRQKAKRPQSVLHSSRSTSFMSFKGIFSGLKIGYAVSEGEEGPMREALERAGAVIVESEGWETGEEVDYLVVRLASPIRPEISKGELVTECWVEACVFKQELLDPASEVVYRPLSVKIPIEAFKETQIHLTAVDDQTAHFARRLIVALGGTISKALSRRLTTHVVSGSQTGLKFEKATEWKIPVLPVDWLYACARSGVLDKVDDFRFPTEVLPPKRPALTSSNLTSNLSIMSETAPLDFTALKVNDKIFPSSSAPVDHVTDALRLLAEREDRGEKAGWKRVRRSRPASRLTGVSHSPHTPVSTSPRARSRSPPAANEDFDESIRVAYVDPVADKEKRRLMDALRKGQMGDAPLGSKRKRVGR